MAIKPITGIHTNDPAWIIALWLAIHGGDPAIDQHGVISAEKAKVAAAGAIRALAAHLDPVQAKAVVAALGH